MFGEYGIIKDSKGLSIPYNFYKGALKSDGNSSDEALKSNSSLKRFAQHLQSLDNSLVSFDFESMNRDLENGMYFDSSIPQGYGVGSSGALVAAIYDKYAHEKITVLENLTREKLVQLKAIFGAMESFFHGKSYLSIPILINSQDNIEATGIPSQSVDGKGAVFLIDSGIVGETAPMVNIFMENLKDVGFRKMLKNEFVKYTDPCVENFLGGDIKSLFSNTKKLSKVVLNNFKPMIPEQFHGIWQKGLDSGDYYLKLCGSGGGGYILGFTEDLDKAKDSLKDYKLEVVYQF